MKKTTGIKLYDDFYDHTFYFNIIEESYQQGSFFEKDARKAVDLVVRPGGWGENGPGVVIIRGTEGPY